MNVKELCKGLRAIEIDGVRAPVVIYDGYDDPLPAYVIARGSPFADYDKALAPDLGIARPLWDYAREQGLTWEWSNRNHISLIEDAEGLSRACPTGHPLDVLKHHVSGAIYRGEAVPIVEQMPGDVVCVPCELCGDVTPANGYPWCGGVLCEKCRPLTPIEALKELFEWDQRTGGWEAPCWGRARRAYEEGRALYDAAPALLEALEAFVKQYEGNGHDEREQRPEMILARAALAKATGGANG